MTWSTSAFALWISFNCQFFPTDSEVYDSIVLGAKARQSTRIWHQKRKKKKISIHALWLHPAAPFGIHFGFLSVAMVTSGTGGATTKCLHWVTAAEARAAWNGVFSKGDRVVPERPARTRGAQKSTSTSWKCHAPGKWGLALGANVIFTHGFYKRGSSSRRLHALEFDKVPGRAIHGLKRGEVCPVSPAADTSTRSQRGEKMSSPLKNKSDGNGMQPQLRQQQSLIFPEEDPKSLRRPVH